MKNLFNKVIEGLSGLPMDDTDDGSTDSFSRDQAHLTSNPPSTSKSPSRRSPFSKLTKKHSQSLSNISHNPSSDSLYQQHQQQHAVDGDGNKIFDAVISPTWQAIVGGANAVFDAILPAVEGEEDDNALTPTTRAARNKAANQLRASNAYPGIAGSSGDLASLGGPEEELLRAATMRAPIYPPLPPLDGSVPRIKLVNGETSAIVDEQQLAAVMDQVPLRFRESSLRLLYSTLRDGISLQTLLRNCRSHAPTVLIVRDMNKTVFGAYCSEPWKVTSRFYGTGETFVFQLMPPSSSGQQQQTPTGNGSSGSNDQHQVAVWHWWHQKMRVEQNDYFMWGQHDAIAVGGSGGYALWLDNDLANGISRNCTTFGSPSLASEEEFRIGAVELWGLY